MLATGNFNVDQVRITIPEGYSRAEISLISQALLPNFDVDKFMNKTQNDEGYLFPDTYFVFPSITTENFIKLLKDNFDTKINPLREDIVASSRSEKDIIKMASIIEKEAHGNEDRYVISGILWNRIDKGMPLQVDATFLYLLGKGSNSLTLEDLKTDSPYNTYIYKGLPEKELWHCKPKFIFLAGMARHAAIINSIDTKYSSKAYRDKILELEQEAIEIISSCSRKKGLAFCQKLMETLTSEFIYSGTFYPLMTDKDVKTIAWLRNNTTQPNLAYYLGNKTEVH
jgi:hypothetical protein